MSTNSLTEEQKTDRVIEWLTRHHLKHEGGYEYDYETHAGKLFVAALDDGKERARTQIDAYDLAYLPRWYDDAESYLIETQGCLDWDDFNFGDWTEAFCETEQE